MSHNQHARKGQEWQLIDIRKEKIRDRIYLNRPFASSEINFTSVRV